MHKSPLFVAGFVFGLIALLHAARLFYGFSVVVNGTEIPFWANGVGLVVAGALSWWMFASARCCCHK